MKISVLVINQNGSGYIKDTLSRIARVGGDLKVLIIDNASDDDSVQQITTNYPNYQLITNHQHLSYTECLNYGLSQAVNSGAQYIWVVGSDVLVDEHSLKELIDLGEKYKDVGMISSKIFNYPDKDNIIYYAGGIMDWFNLVPVNRGNGQVDVGQFEHDVETDFALPQSVLIKNRIITEVGLLDPAYFSQYDWLDYCFKLRRYSWRMMYSCQSKVWYRALKDDGLPSGVKEYFIVRNQLLFGLRYAPFYTKFALVKNAFRQYFFGHPWQRRAVLDFFTGNFGRGSYQP